MEQRIGQMPVNRLKPCPAFHNTYIDLFGPFEIKGLVHKRSKGKCFGVLFTCGSSRAVHCDLSPDYSTDGLLQTIRRFVSLRSYPAHMYSDLGSQLVAADKQLRSVMMNIDNDKLKEFGAMEGLQWHFSSPNAPCNGCFALNAKSVHDV